MNQKSGEKWIKKCSKIEPKSWEKLNHCEKRGPEIGVEKWAQIWGPVSFSNHFLEREIQNPTPKSLNFVTPILGPETGPKNAKKIGFFLKKKMGKNWNHFSAKSGHCGHKMGSVFASRNHPQTQGNLVVKSGRNKCSCGDAEIQRDA